MAERTSEPRTREGPREREVRLRALFEKATVGLAQLTPDGHWIRVNQRFCDIVGYTQAELLQLSVRDITHPNDLETNLACARRMLDGEIATYVTEKRYIRKDGQPVWIHLSCALIRNRHGDPDCFVTVAQDIDSRKRAEAERRTLEAELRHAQKMEALGVLATGVAHEFNNFLTAIMGYADVARTSLPPGSPAAIAVDGIEQAVRRAGGVTQSLLTLSRKGLPCKKPIRIGECVGETVRMLRGMLPARIEIATDLSAAADLWVLADSTQLQQVLINLAVNARDAMPEGGRLNIVVRPGGGLASSSERCATLIVEDNGSGMSPAVRVRIFEPFFTTKTADRGTGLGLAIVRRIIDDCGGAIELSTSERQGTRFTVTLPRCESRGAEENDSRPAPIRRGRGERIIVVDDEPQILDILVSTLEAAGYAVIQAADGDTAMKLFRRHHRHVRLAVLDLDLPGKSGTACLREMRAKRPQLAAVLITGGSRLQLEAHLGPLTRLLPKPFRIHELERAVSQLLDVAEQTASPA